MDYDFCYFANIIDGHDNRIAYRNSSDCYVHSGTDFDFYSEDFGGVFVYNIAVPVDRPENAGDDPRNFRTTRKVYTMTRRDLAINESAVVSSVGGQGSLRQHLLDMGIIPGVVVRMVRLAPMGDPIEIRIQDYELTLRLADAERIAIEPLTNHEVLQNLTIQSQSANTRIPHHSRYILPC